MPDTRHYPSSNAAWSNVEGHWEELVLTKVSSDGKMLTLTEPLKYDHLGARDADGKLEFLGHVMNLRRNIILRSENDQGVRGHTLFGTRADIDIRYVLFRGLGRTTTDKLDNTAFNENGNVTHIGTNQVARYGFHAHHLVGPVETPANGFQFTAIGNAIDGGFDGQSFRWGITIHGSHYGLVRNNVVYTIGGAGIVTEDGTESFNVIENNFVVLVDGPGTITTHDRGNAGSGFWFRGHNNYIRDNVASNCFAAAYSINAYRVGEVRIPFQKGDMPHMNGQFKVINMGATPLLEFARNEGYGVMQKGFDIWEVGGRGNDLEDVPNSFIRDLRLWHFSREGIFTYRSHRLFIDGYVARGDFTTSNSPYAGGAMAIRFDHQYVTRLMTVRNADIQGLLIGIGTPPPIMIPNHIRKVNWAALSEDERKTLIDGKPGQFIVENCYLRNARNIIIGTPTSGPDVIYRQTIIRNVDFEALVFPNHRWADEHFAIHMDYLDSGSRRQYRIKDKVIVENYDQIPGKGLQIFYKEQAPNFIMPQTQGNILGSPEEGLTNQQNWNKHGIAIGGSIASCSDDTTYPRISGFTCPVDSVEPPQSDIPETPSNLVATVLSSSKIELNWQDNSDNETHFRIERKQGNGSFNNIATVDVNTVNYLDSDLQASSVYSYQVRAENPTGNSGFSNQVTKTTQSSNSPFPVALQRRNLPEEVAVNLQVKKPVGSGSIATLTLTVFDADTVDEGELEINGNGRIPLFGDQATWKNNNKPVPIAMTTPAEWWNNGLNILRFVHTRTGGFRIDDALVDFEIASSDFPIALQGRNLPEEVTAKLDVNKPSAAPNTAVLSLITFDADTIDEGELEINGNGPIQLFGDQASWKNNRKTAPITVATPADWWNSGTNVLRFIHTKTGGYRIENASVKFEVTTSLAKSVIKSATTKLPSKNDGEPGSKTVYEDAEDGTTNGWHKYNQGTITNISDGANGSKRAIEFTGDIQNDVFRLTTVDGSNWNNTREFFAEFSVAFNRLSPGAIYFQIATDRGVKYLVYGIGATNDNKDPNMIYFDLGDISDGQWHTIKRDLEKDLKSRYRNAKLKAVKGFFVYGSLKLDNIVLFD